MAACEIQTRDMGTPLPNMCSSMDNSHLSLNGLACAILRFSSKVVGVVFLYLLTVTVVGLSTIKNEYTECAGM